MSTVEVFRVRHGRYQAYDGTQYYGQDTLDGWVDSLARSAHHSLSYNKVALHNLNVMQTVVEAIQIAERYSYSSYRLTVREIHPVIPAQTVVVPGSVCAGPPTPVPGEHQYKTVEAHDGSVYKVGKYFPVTGPETAYYEIEDKYDFWQSIIKAKILDDHLVSGNWKETDV